MHAGIHQTLWIELPDGTRLAATLWLPEGDGPFPTVLEFLPYRRGDGTAMRDDTTYPGFAAAGIAGLRVDSRGQGDSDGLFDDEYSPRELQDICDVIAWTATQGWSNGSVGMMGISWGGFNGLQVAALRPPALKAVISIASTADRYNDDIHYKGGCLLSANVYWAGTMLSYTSRPPDPQVVGNRWAEIWRNRLDNIPMLLETWLTHQHRDAYWQHGSICEDWSAITCPVWVIAGYADGYRNCPATLARHLSAPVKATTGPWVHKYPHFAWPKPRADFIGMASAWFNEHLAGAPNGTADWPDHAAYRIEAATPSDWRAADAGHWVDAPTMAPESVTLALAADHRLTPVQTSETGANQTPATDIASGPITIATPQDCGVAAGEYFTLAPNGDMPVDQAEDDAKSVCWTMAISDAPLDIMGRPHVTLPIAIDQQQGNLIARLVDVHPDGTAALIARGVLNLCHRGDGVTPDHASPRAMVPGETTRVTVTLDETAYRLRPGHQLRLALSTAYWPLILPSPAPVTATLSAGADARLTLPVDPALREIDMPAPADPDPMPSYPTLSEGAATRAVTRDPATGATAVATTYRILDDSGLTEVPRTGMRMRDVRDETWTILPDDPTATVGHLRFVAERSRDGWATETVAEITFRCTPDSYDVTATLEATHDGQPFTSRAWQFSVPRHLV